MQVSKPVKYGVLFLVAVLATGLFWLGLNRYWAEQRATALVNAPQAQQQVAPAPAAPESAAAAAQGEKPQAKVYVHVVGAVARPGVYQLEQGGRISEAIEAAGGALPDGVPDALNLAARVNDGDKIYVHTRQELEAQATPAPAARGATVAPVKTAVSAETGSVTTGVKVNINQASAKELEKVSGIGAVTAKAIVDYRTKHGPFQRLEDLQKVSGIGPKTLEKLRPHLTV